MNMADLLLNGITHPATWLFVAVMAAGFYLGYRYPFGGDFGPR